jgi:prophage antirepressor-like protein
MSKIKLFESKQIRSVWNEADQKWYFAVVDVVQVLTDSSNPTDYLKKLRKRDLEISKGWGQIVTPLLIDTAGGKQRLNCANAEGLLRLIQSIPSPKAEPFKRWLARVGYERLEEIEDPELASKRAKEIYKAKGHPVFSMLGEASTTKIARA